MSLNTYTIHDPLQPQKGNFSKKTLDMLTLDNDPISYVTHVLDPLYVFLRPLIGNLHVVRLPS